MLREFQSDPPGIVRGLVSCTGIDYCHFALIETKELAVKTAHELQQKLPAHKFLTMHWSGCPAGCGNHAAADIGLLGKNVRIDGEVVDAVDVFVGKDGNLYTSAGISVRARLQTGTRPDARSARDANTRRGGQTSAGSH